MSCNRNLAEYTMSLAGSILTTVIKLGRCLHTQVAASLTQRTRTHAAVINGSQSTLSQAQGIATLPRCASLFQTPPHISCSWPSPACQHSLPGSSTCQAGVLIGDQSRYCSSKGYCHITAILISVSLTVTHISCSCPRPACQHNQPVSSASSVCTPMAAVMSSRTLCLVLQGHAAGKQVQAMCLSCKT